MKLECDQNVIDVCKVYPYAYRCEDRHGYYIVDGTVIRERPVIGFGKNAAKAWKNAADNIKKAAKKAKKKRA